MNTNSASPDRWGDGAAYEAYIGRWSRLVAREFLAWLAIAPSSQWLELGCGTGMLTRTIVQNTQPAGILAIDRSPNYVMFARQQVPDARVRFDTADAQQLAAEDQMFDAVVSGLLLNFLPQPQQALGEMRRVVRPGGTVAAYVWDYAGKMELLRYFWDAAVAMNPQAAPQAEGHRFPLCQPKPLADLFYSAELRQVEVRAITIATTFKDFDDYWQPFLGGQGPAAGYLLSIPEQWRSELRERLRQCLPTAQDGTIALTAQAWAVRGVR